MLKGDEVVTRRNDRGLMVKNRDHWTITNIRPDHSVTLTGTLHLPAEYVAADLELGYAQTSHATQGRTVDTAFLLVDTLTDSRGVYTPLTRGREANHAYVVTDDNQTSLDVLTRALAREWIDQPAVARRLGLDPDRSSHLTPDGAGDEEEAGERARNILRLIEERRAPTREKERSLGRSL